MLLILPFWYKVVLHHLNSSESLTSVSSISHLYYAALQKFPLWSLSLQQLRALLFHNYQTFTFSFLQIIMMVITLHRSYTTVAWGPCQDEHFALLVMYNWQVPLASYVYWADSIKFYYVFFMSFSPLLEPPLLPLSQLSVKVRSLCIFWILYL